MEKKLKLNLLVPGVHQKVTHLNKSGLFKYVWPFSGYQVLKGYATVPDNLRFSNYSRFCKEEKHPETMSLSKLERQSKWDLMRQRLFTFPRQNVNV